MLPVRNGMMMKEETGLHLPRDQRTAPASPEPAERIAPSLLELLECLLAGGLHVLPGGLVGLLDLLKKLPCFVGIRTQLSDPALIIGAGLGSRLAEVHLIFLDLRLPDLDLAFQLFRKVLLQSHDRPPAWTNCAWVQPREVAARPAAGYLRSPAVTIGLFLQKGMGANLRTVAADLHSLLVRADEVIEEAARCRPLAQCTPASRQRAGGSVDLSLLRPGLRPGGRLRRRLRSCSCLLPGLGLP